MRRSFIALLAVLALAAGALAGCGSVAHYGGGVIVHHVVNHLAPSHRRTVNKVFCLYHGHRVLVDVKQHHWITAGANAYSAYKSCKAGFGHNK